VELNDGYLVSPEGMSLTEETTEHRQLCGEGEFDLVGLIKAIQATGYDGVYGVEVLNKELKTWPLEKAVTRVYETTMWQFGQV
jgi:sugar phosphate isomerase/epimerase